MTNHSHSDVAANTCSQCGQKLRDEIKYTYSFKKWATPVFVLLICLMLVSIDISISESVTWSFWASLGIWIFYIPVQLLRTTPNQSWIIIPFAALLFSIFLLGLDKNTGDNSGAFGLDWAGTAVIPILTIFFVFPILGHNARDEPNEQERLALFVEQLEAAEKQGS